MGARKHANTHTHTWLKTSTQTSDILSQTHTPKVYAMYKYGLLVPKKNKKKGSSGPSLCYFWISSHFEPQTWDIFEPLTQWNCVFRQPSCRRDSESLCLCQIEDVRVTSKDRGEWRGGRCCSHDCGTQKTKRAKALGVFSLLSRSYVTDAVSRFISGPDVRSRFFPHGFLKKSRCQTSV